MQIEHLQIELRPRTNAQALDLGFALLRSHAGPAYLAFIALWLPLIALCAGVTVLFPKFQYAWILAWWLKPLLERAPLYVLSRQVFGTSVTWQEALRAWPRQLGGGWFRLLTWGRLFAAGRGLLQPVWQLEMARGKVARARMRVLGKRTWGSAFLFGLVCAQFEGVLELGIFGFIGFFVSDSELSNPFAFFVETRGLNLTLLWLAIYGAGAALMAPIYTACCFTLYLNRRASLEAWDIELQLRQIRRPVAAKPRAHAAAAATGAALLVLFTLSLAMPPAAMAAAPAKCAWKDAETLVRGADNGPGQAAVRRQVDQIFDGADLRDHECVQTWKAKVPAKSNKKQAEPVSLPVLADIFRVLVIAAGIGALAWLLYRYRHAFPAFRFAPTGTPATEVGGLDIRAESLPADVGATVRALWRAGQRRAALALLYRATLSRLVAEDGLPLRQGNTEGDCLRLARQAQRLSPARLAVAAAATALWLDGAYADRWPDDATLEARCAAWDAQFGAAGQGAA